MSSQTLTIGADSSQSRPTTNSPTSTHKARAGMAMSLATFAMAAASGIQAVLYLSRFGTNARTDGFFVAFALYSTFGVFSQSLRLTSVPLLVEPGARLSAREFAITLGLIALPVALLTGPLAGPLAHLIAPGLKSSGRSVTAAALPVLGAAMILQLWAAGAATVLAIHDRFTTIAGAYMAGACTGLVVFLAIMSEAGVQTLGWSMLSMAAVTCTWMLVGVRRSGALGGRSRSRSLKSLLSNCGVVLVRTAIYLAFNVLFVITLAFASRSAAGETTVLSYSYLFASYLVAGTGMALGMSSIPDMTREARTEQRAALIATVPRGFRYAILLVAPALAGLITCGAPLIHAVLPKSLTAAEVHTLQVFAALLVPWTLAALLVNFLLPVLLALGRARLLGALAVPLVVIHIAATAIGTALFGVDGAVGAFFVAPTCLAVVLFVAGVGRDGAATLAREVGGNGARFILLTVIAFGVGWVLSMAAPAGLAQAAVAGVIGCAIYAVELFLVARPQLEVLIGTVVVRPTPA
jgi:peptidoglycan biosynthesis protein MviN/MurJ (putative lipid II flippase)